MAAGLSQLGDCGWVIVHDGARPLVTEEIIQQGLTEAKETGAQILVTACPKCQVHLTCAMKDEHLGGSLDIEIRDLAALVADALPSSKGM